MFQNLKIGFGEPEKGKLLISEPFMFDPNFKRTVILLTENNDEGTVGFILNKQTDLTISDIIEEFPLFDAPVYFGGPVQPETLHYVHTKGDLFEDSVEIVEGVYWGGNFELLKSNIESGMISSSDLRFFIGYSGWAPDQLEAEIKEKSWILTPADEESIFSIDSESLWKQVLKEMGKEYEIISNFPENPNLN